MQCVAKLRVGVYVIVLVVVFVIDCDMVNVSGRLNVVLLTAEASVKVIWRALLGNGCARVKVVFWRLMSLYWRCCCCLMLVLSETDVKLGRVILASFL